jgi:hypothetical protein
MFYLPESSGGYTCCVDYDNVVPTNDIDTVFSSHPANIDTSQLHRNHNIGPKDHYQCTDIECIYFILSIADWSLCNINSTTQTFDDRRDCRYFCRLDCHCCTHLRTMLLLLLLRKTSEEGKEKQKIRHTDKKVV